jgi:hypothetical protein
LFSVPIPWQQLINRSVNFVAKCKPASPFLERPGALPEPQIKSSAKHILNMLAKGRKEAKEYIALIYTA